MASFANVSTNDDLPASLQAETAILGAMMIDTIAISDAMGRLVAEDFSLDSHRRIFGAIASLSGAGENVDSITVRESLKRKKELDSVGGPAYLAFLSDGIPRNFNIESYVRIVKDKSSARKIMALGHDAAARASDGGEDAQTIAESVAEALRQITEDAGDHELQTAGEWMAHQEAAGVPESLAPVDGVRVGFPSLDEATLGFQPGDLVIVAARPSMGKTAWACNVVHHIAVRSSLTVAMFSLEQKKSSILRRMYAASARVDLKAIRSGFVRSDEARLIEERRQEIARAPLYLDDTPGLTVSRIRSKCARLKRTKGLDIIFVDQLSHVDGSDVATRGMDLRQIVGKQTKALKKMGQELGVPVVVFNQLGRDVGKRSDPRPRLEDLKESGNIEEDADLVIFLHRPDYYDKKDPALTGLGELILAKHRDGETLTVACEYQGRVVRWSESDSEKQSAFSGMTSEKQYRYDYSEDRDRMSWP